MFAAPAPIEREFDASVATAGRRQNFSTATVTPSAASFGKASIGTERRVLMHA